MFRLATARRLWKGAARRGEAGHGEAVLVG